MPEFEYTAYQRDDPTASSTTDRIRAESREAATRMLNANGYVPTRLREVREESKGVQVGRVLTSDVGKLFQRVKTQELAFFTSMFATLRDAGIDVLETLEILERNTKNEVLRDVIVEMQNDISQGVQLSDAMARHPKVFDALYVGMVRAGEKTKVAPALFRQAEMLEVSAQTKREVRSMMMYPVVVLIFSLAVFVAMMIFVIPAFQGIFDSLNGQLPKPTQILIDVSDFCKTKWWLFPVIFGGAGFGFVKWKNSPSGEIRWDRFKLDVPKIGEMNKKVVTARFARTLATLQDNGVDLVDALRTSASTTDNKVVEMAIEDAIEGLSHGGRMTESLRESGAFPDIALAMMEAGEVAGRVPYMLDKTAEVYEKEVANTVKGLKAIVEPLMMGVVGVFIGAIVIALYLPMFSIYDQIK